MGYTLSVTTQYGLATAVLFLIKDTFSSAKLIASLDPVGASDSTSGPYGTVSNMVLFIGYCGYLVLYRSMCATSPIFFVGGIGM